MSKIFLPSCKVKASLKNPSGKLKAYLEKTEYIRTAGCCKVFCGADLLEPCTDVEKEFAPQRYAVDGAHMYTPLSPKEQWSVIAWPVWTG